MWVFCYSSHICYHHLQEVNCHTLKTKCCRKFTKLRSIYKTTEGEINVYVIFSSFFPFFIWRKKSLESVLYFLCICMSWGVKSILQRKSQTSIGMFIPLQNFFHEGKNNDIFALLFLNCRLWMKNNRVNYKLASGPFKGERCFRKTETRQHQVLSALIMTSSLFETPLCFQIKVYQTRQ